MCQHFAKFISLFLEKLRNYSCISSFKRFWSKKMSSKLYIALLLCTVIAFVTSEGNCPDYTNKVCPLYYKINHCCAQSDCRSGDICCVQACGNVCRRQSDKPIGKEKLWNRFRYVTDINVMLDYEKYRM